METLLASCVFEMTGTLESICDVAGEPIGPAETCLIASAQAAAHRGDRARRAWETCTPGTPIRTYWDDQYQRAKGEVQAFIYSVLVYRQYEA